MDPSSSNNRDAVTETSEFDFDFYSISSSSVSTETSISTQVSAFSSTLENRPPNKSTREADHISNTNRNPYYTDLSLPVLRLRDATTSTDKISFDYSTSTMSSSLVVSDDSSLTSFYSASKSSVKEIETTDYAKDQKRISKDLSAVKNIFLDTTSSIGSSLLDELKVAPHSSEIEIKKGTEKVSDKFVEKPVLDGVSVASISSSLFDELKLAAHSTEEDIKRSSGDLQDIKQNTGNTKQQIAQKMVKNSVFVDDSKFSIGSSMLDELKFAPHSTEVGIKRSSDDLHDKKRDTTDQEPLKFDKKPVFVDESKSSIGSNMLDELRFAPHSTEVGIEKSSEDLQAKMRDTTDQEPQKFDKKPVFVDDSKSSIGSSMLAELKFAPHSTEVGIKRSSENLQDKMRDTTEQVPQKFDKKPVFVDDSKSSIGSSMLDELKFAPHSTEVGIKRSSDDLHDKKRDTTDEQPLKFDKKPVFVDESKSSIGSNMLDELRFAPHSTEVGIEKSSEDLQAKMRDTTDQEPQKFDKKPVFVDESKSSIGSNMLDELRFAPHSTEVGIEKSSEDLQAKMRDTTDQEPQKFDKKPVFVDESKSSIGSNMLDELRFAPHSTEVGIEKSSEDLQAKMRDTTDQEPQKFDKKPVFVDDSKSSIGSSMLAELKFAPHSTEVGIKRSSENLEDKMRDTTEQVPQKFDKKPVFVDDSKSSIDSSMLDELKFAPHSTEIGIKTSSEVVGENQDLSSLLAKEDAEIPREIPDSSKSRHAKSVTSSEASQAPALLKSSKSQHVRQASDNSDDDDSEDDERESTNLRIGHVFVYMVIPPDGGYGWLITFISFLCQIVVDGIIFSIGIVLPHIEEDLNIPGSKVVLVASMQVGFYFLFGTVSSAFINKFGFRPVALAGCLLSITTLLIATFSVNLPMMIFFYSIMGGPALSMVWVSSQLIIGYYFDKYRPIANGASCSGAGAGIMIFCYMNSVLVPQIGWRNLMRVHVGFLMVVLLMALAFIEVVPTRIGRIKEALADDTDSESFDLLTGLTQYSRYSLKIDDQEYPLDDNFKTVLETPTVKESKSPNFCYNSLQSCFPSLQKYFERRREQKAKEEATKRYVIKQDLIERHDLFYMGPKDHKKEQEKVDELLQKRATQRASIEDAQGGEWRTISLEEFSKKHKRKTIINTLSTMHMVKDQQLRWDQRKIKELKRKEKQSLWDFLSPKNLLHPKIRKAFSLLFDFRLLAIMEFRILLLSAFLFPMGFNIPFVFSTVRVQIDASFARLISPTIGFSNFAFRIASGFVAFKFCEYTTYICGGGMFFGGVAVLVSAFYGLDVVWFQFVYAMCYGIAPAFYSTLRAIIYVRSLGLDKLTNAFGLTALAMGLGVFIGTTAGGILNDFTGSYTASFIFAGICICTSGALKLLLPYLIKLSKAKEGK